MKTMNKKSRRLVSLFMLTGAILLVVGIISIAIFSITSRNVQTNTTNSSKGDDSVFSTITPSVSETPTSPSYTLKDAIADIKQILVTEVCSEASIMENSFKQVGDTDAFIYKGGESRVDSNLKYAYVQYGCGGYGGIAVLIRSDNSWKLLGESARIYPNCNFVDKQGIPLSVVDKCYPSDRDIEPVKITS